MNRTIVSLLCFGICFTTVVSAQDGKSSLPGKSIVKVNLSSIALSHYSLQYEYVLNNRQSIALGLGVSPREGLPFKQTLLDNFGENADARSAIESTTFSKFTITPEYRFYLGKKGAPSGFYIAPFARYTNMSFDNDYTYTPSSGEKHVAHVTGKFNGIGGGVMVGSQWLLSSRVTLDWWIAGPFIGTMKADFHGTDDMSDMTPQDKAELENDIESVDIPLWEIDATVGNNTIDAKLTGPFYGIRAFGISLGLRL
jgi:hypothetical protein